jgi:hypothetical protein
MRSSLVPLALLLAPTLAFATEYQADPANYEEIVPALVAGDTLHLAAGTYEHITLAGLHGTEAARITISGPENGPPAVFVADPGRCCNTVEIVDSSFLTIKRITVDGQHINGVFGISAKQGIVHHIRIEDCDLINHDGSQQTVAISTKVATWGWEILDNRIRSVGTGLYLGDSDGSDPFIGGVIAGNLVEDAIGYCMEIKWQQPRTLIEGMPTDPTTTIIRDNVFIKTDRPSENGDRPNVLVGGFPPEGPGSQDRYEIYGNFFFHNPRESLFQGSGRVTLHDNIFVDTAGSAILLRDHDLPLRLATVYGNTIYQAQSGIVFGSPAPAGDAVFGNVVFAGTPIAGSISDQRDNVTGSVGDAARFLSAPGTTLGAMDFYPLPGQCTGPPLDVAKVLVDTDHGIDFNGVARGDRRYRGAYAGEGENPGWALAGEQKAPGAVSGPDGGGDGGSDDDGDDVGRADAEAGSGGDAGPTPDPKPEATADAGQDPGGGDEVAGGCGCRTTTGRASDTGLAALLLLCLAPARGRRR